MLLLLNLQYISRYMYVIRKELSSIRELNDDDKRYKEQDVNINEGNWEAIELIWPLSERPEGKLHIHIFTRSA